MTVDSSPFQPLAGTRVLDLGMNIAGPQATSLLADLGADVVKVESPTGDTSRGMEPRAADGTSAMAYAMNRSKRCVALDLRSPKAAQVLEVLLRWADVAVQNLRPGKAEVLGVDAAACHAVNPRLVHVSVEAFYPVDAGRPGYDLMVQAESGMLHLTGDAAGPPARLPGSLLDHTTGLWAAYGAAAALHGERDRVALTITMADVAQHLLGDRVAAHLLTGESPVRMGSATSVVTPLGAYPTATTEIVLGAASDTLFRRLSSALGVALADDPRFVDNAGRLAHRAALDDAITAALHNADADTWVERLDAAGVPVGQVRDLPDAVELHRRHSRTGLAPVHGVPGASVVANPLTGPAPVRGPGRVGADNRDVLVDTLGLNPDLVAKLEDSGVLA
ncbi:MAG: CoA transferase [Nocardioides sp.]|nr:CoA transferase [Nocardioides sp.]